MIISCRLPNAALQVVRNDDLGDTAEKIEGTDMGADPVLNLLAQGGFGIGVVAGPEYCDKDLGLANLAGETVYNANGLTGIIDKEFFAGTMLMTHGHI